MKKPLPPGALSGLWRNEELYHEYYYGKFPGFYDTMDSGYYDENGYVTIVSRTDDVINVAAHRIATGAIEECLVEIPEILETAVVGKNHTLKGKVPVAFVVLKTSDKKNTRSILNTAGTKVTDTLGRFSAVHEFYVVKRLPKTRSGKTPRNTLTAICNKDDYIVPSTIDDELVYPEIHELLEDTDNIFRFEAKSS